MFPPHGPMTSTQTSIAKMIQNLINSAIGKVFVASSVEIVRRRLTFYFPLYKASAVPGEVAGMWHAQGPDLNTGLPLGQQWMSRLLALRAVTWAERSSYRYTGQCCRFFRGPGLV